VTEELSGAFVQNLLFAMFCEAGAIIAQASFYFLTMKRMKGMKD